MTEKKPARTDRREFLKGSAAAAALLATGLPAVHARGSDEIKVGVIGCGGRGSGAARDSLAGSPNTRIHALGDLFPDRLESCRQRLSSDSRGEVPRERCFSGFDAYKKVLETDVDLVILTTPPGFRPQHLRAAIEAGKHVFAEKPVAVCPTGVRHVIETADLAAEKRLALVAGTQRRHQPSYMETVQRIQDGQIGQLVAAQCYWNQGGLWSRQRQPEQSDVEWQIRNWLYFAWLSGDHIVEQHIHNLDVINWVVGEHPTRCVGMGGRQARTAEVFGHIYDHFAVEYEYPGGVRMLSMCRQIANCANNIGERVLGTEGSANPASSLRGRTNWRYEGRDPSPFMLEHRALVRSIMDGQPLNEGRQVAESTLTAIMGRMSAYTGQAVTWEQALNSELDLMKPEIEFGPLPVDPVPVPGRRGDGA